MLNNQMNFGFILNDEVTSRDTGYVVQLNREHIENYSIENK